MLSTLLCFVCRLRGEEFRFLLPGLRGIHLLLPRTPAVAHTILKAEIVFRECVCVCVCACVLVVRFLCLGCSVAVLPALRC